MKINELMLTEGFSAAAKKWVKSEYPEAMIKGNDVLIPMSAEQYKKGTASLLSNFDLYCPENERHIGKDWSVTYKNGNAVVALV